LRHPRSNSDNIVNTALAAVPVARSPIQSIDRAARLLFLLAEAGREGLELRQLVTATELKTSTAHSLLSALVTHRLAERVPGQRKYRLGSAFFELHRRYLTQFDLAPLAARPARELWERTAETVFVSVLGNDARRVDLITLVGPQTLSVNSMRGGSGDATKQGRFGLHASAAGKVFLAGMNRAGVEDLLRSHELTPLTANTITSLEDVLDELDRVRARGFATNFEESDVGVCGIAAPLLDAAGVTVASLCIGYPAGRHSDNYMAALQRELLRTAEQISVLLGASPVQ
jgi:DNA-binding IclR family transcriptional regulator